MINRYRPLIDVKFFSEYDEGTKLMKDSFPSIGVLGGSGVLSCSREYADAFRLCKELAQNGYNIVTGGGEGIMEAANKGALEGNSKSYGLNLSGVAQDNPYVSPGLSKSFYNLSIRKTVMIENCCLFLFFPGGFGTFDELFEICALIQAEHMTSLPLFLIEKDFWKEFLRWFCLNIVNKGYAKDALAENFILIEPQDVLSKIQALISPSENLKRDILRH
ncbi:MAG: LOG family protein [Victivallaceae bacterium]